MPREGQWRFQALGTPQLIKSDGSAVRCERKTLALLAYLALEGRTSRSKLAGLLWPDRAESVARNNLSQLVRRVRQLCGGDVIQASDTLELTDMLLVDAAQLWALHLVKRDAEVITLDGTLLDGIDLDDCPELADWLVMQRERLVALRVEASRREMTRHERSGDVPGAIACAQKLLHWDALSEDAYRQLMRLHYLNGDRAAALRCFERCKRALLEHLGTEPLAETRDLAALIERDAPLPVLAARTPRIPVSVQRPPNLIGREREWTQLDAASRRARVILVTGPAGVGKTRLVQDFAATKGRVALMQGRPGDQSVPYACLARHARRWLDGHPLESLPVFVRQELTRLLPDVTEQTRGTPTGEASTVRFHSALEVLVRRNFAGAAVVVLDDVQFMDDASFDFLALMLANAHGASDAPGSPDEQDAPLFVIVYRSGELSEQAESSVDNLIDRGVAARVHVSPLTADVVAALVQDMNVNADASLASALTAYTGGNPLFIVETVKYLLETNTLQQGLPPQLPPQGRAESVLTHRLRRLSKNATYAVRAAAVLDGDASAELVAEMLSVPVMDVADAWEELERAGILHRERFSHDLMREAVRHGMPESVGALLHRSAARTLERRAASAARIAQHWLRGNDPRSAGPWLVRAGDAAAKTLRGREAADFYAQAISIFQAADDHQAAFDARVRRARAVAQLNDREFRQRALDDLFDWVRSNEHAAQAWHLQSELHADWAEGEDAERAALEGLRVLGDTDDRALRANLLADVGGACWVQGRAEEAASWFERALALLKPLGDTPDLAAHLSNYGVVLDHLDRHRDAVTVHRRACTLCEQLKDYALLSIAWRNLSVCLAELGEARESLHFLKRSLELESSADGTTMGHANAHALLGRSLTDLGEYAAALSCYERALSIPGVDETLLGGIIRTTMGEIMLTLGVFERARAWLEAARDWPNMPVTLESRVLTLLGLLAHACGQRPLPLLNEAERLAETSGRPLSRLRVLLARAPLLPPAEAERDAHEALALAVQHQLGGYEVTALMRLASVLHALGDDERAGEYARAAMTLLDRREPADMTRGEAYLTSAQVLARIQSAQAREALGKAHEWLRTTMTHHVPVEHREDFLRRSRIGQALRHTHVTRVSAKE